MIQKLKTKSITVQGYTYGGLDEENLLEQGSCIFQRNTVKPLNNGHFGTSTIIERLSSLRGKIKIITVL